MDELTVQLQRLDPGLPIPTQAHPGDAGFDLYAAESVTLLPMERTLIRTGVAVAIPEGFAGYVQPRSGLAHREGLGIVNSPGLVDSGYRGEIKIIAINLDPETPLKLERGDRIAQLVFLPIPQVTLEEVSELPPSSRGDGGFGSTG